MFKTLSDLSSSLQRNGVRGDFGGWEQVLGMKSNEEEHSGRTGSFSSPLAGEDSETQRSVAELLVDLGEGYRAIVGVLAHATPHQLRLTLTSFAKSSYPLPQGERGRMRCKRSLQWTKLSFHASFQRLILQSPNFPVHHCAAMGMTKERARQSRARER